jgi:L-ascorbate metabolism protein UlaG (beta-lactamase superfamily)
MAQLLEVSRFVIIVIGNDSRKAGYLMDIQLLRHATLVVKINEKMVLVDPMLSQAEAMPPIVNSTNERRNPLVAIVYHQDLWQQIDAVLLTHMHRDHFDDAAARELPKDKRLFCQPEDELKLKELGFLQITPIHDQYCWEGITITRTAGQHGTGEIGVKMAPVSGYILQSEGEPTLYLAGDTIYCPEVESALQNYHPHVTIVNAGAAQFSKGDPITMTAQDIGAVCRFEPKTTVVAVHMEAINHCLLSREELQNYLAKEGFSEQVLIPADGEVLFF